MIQNDIKKKSVGAKNVNKMADTRYGSVEIKICEEYNSVYNNYNKLL